VGHKHEPSENVISDIQKVLRCGSGAESKGWV